jgi:predicted amidohydrolase YtcJ
MTLLIADAEVEGRRVDVRLGVSHIAEIGHELTRQREEERYDAAGGALLPGLHDHHLHLHAMAAAARSARCGPPEVNDLAGLVATLRDADATLRPSAWFRGVGYHESVGGMLDRNDLDRILPERPVRIQHRGGGLWLVNSAGLAALGLLSGRPLPDGVESDPTGQPTGRLWRADEVFRTDADLPDLASVGQRLLSLGITGVTDATPSLDCSALGSLVAARRDGSLPQRLVALGTPDDWADQLVERGARKLLLHDHDLPSLDDLVDLVAGAHRAGRPVAVHCVTRTSLVLTIAALEAAGSVAGDRIEHASVVPPELTGALRSLQVRVVTQPSFVRDRGDAYLAAVDADDVECLYPYATLLDAEIPVAASSDAPFGNVDPWRTLEAAESRRTAGGSILGAHERVSARQALAGYLSKGDLPGGSARRIQVGAPSDICLLSVPLDTALAHPDARHVAMVLAGDARYDASDVSEGDG